MPSKALEIAVPMAIAATAATRMAIAAARAFTPVSVIASNANVFISIDLLLGI